MWCHHRDCTSDVYVESQKSKRITIESNIKLILEEYDNEKKRGDQGLGRLKKLMEERDIIRLLPGTVPGFVLRNRKWVLLDLLQLGPVDQDNGWSNLVLPPGHRQLVQAMVETHTQQLNSNRDAKLGMDIVRGKGRGCIILLHGVPGVGKTSTAECVAAHTKKPLYPITCGETDLLRFTSLFNSQQVLTYLVKIGDIGYRPEDVERNMEHHFRLAHKWGCVLLLDEGDVFLAKRDQKDVQRNGLVSVFLRILEYYSGILFLTTNRVGAIDDAFRSRLHLTLYYPKLTKKQTKEIFKHNFERIAEINTNRKLNGLPPFEYKDSESKIMDWVMETWKAMRWNGRQIHNAFQTVLALAEFQENSHGGESAPRVLTRQYFKVVAIASTQFNDYLLATHDMGEDKVAKREYMRALSYSPPSELVFKGLNQESSDSTSEEEEEDDDGSETDSEPDEFDESDNRKDKKKNRGKKGKISGKKSKKSTGKRGNPGKKLKDKKKETKESEESEDSE
ncbi:ATPase-AAA-core domain-containing protein [Fusarium sp. LHS14.1]|nr:ATPase-AAA-core domain-containing protein [Fusarium sp. LHS14.1]